MNDTMWNRIVMVFHVICWTTTLALIFFWIYEFYLNKDLCIVDYKKYYESKEDQFPMLSICLRDPFSDTSLMLHGHEINRSSYSKFLQGKYFNPKMLDINYKNSTMDISDYVVEYHADFRNGTSTKNSVLNGKNKLFRFSHAIFWYNKFYNCFELQVPHDNQITYFGVALRASVFQSNIRPPTYGMLSFLHYPNHLLTSGGNMRFALANNQPYDNMVMRYKVDGMEVIHRRNKASRPCHLDSKHYDERIMKNHIKNVGCRAPYQDNVYDFKPCQTKELMKKALLSIRMDDYGITSPCRAMKKIDYRYEEFNLLRAKESNTGHIYIGIYHFDDSFKEILQIR